ncbi:MAG: division/cell wall cluster transcriptional repressor MraZ [Candidatus Neomarinimicrobiota bacterium]
MISSFSGESKHSLDDKGRLNVPAKFRRWLNEDDAEYSFVVTKGLDPCLIAYPFAEWDIKSEKLLKLSEFNKINRAFIRAFSRNAMRLKCDKQGRILIPQQLLALANIQKEVVIVGVLNCLELWDPEMLASHAESQRSLDDEYFENLGGTISS